MAGGILAKESIIEFTSSGWMKGEQAQALAHGKTPPTHEAPVPLQTIIINP